MIVIVLYWQNTRTMYARFHVRFTIHTITLESRSVFEKRIYKTHHTPIPLSSVSPFISDTDVSSIGIVGIVGLNDVRGRSDATFCIMGIVFIRSNFFCLSTIVNDILRL